MTIAEEFRRLAVARYGATGWRRKCQKEFGVDRKTVYRWSKQGPKWHVLLALRAPRTGRTPSSNS